MNVHNTWVLDLTYKITKAEECDRSLFNLATLSLLVHLVFLDRGRRAISPNAGSDGRYEAIYLSRVA